jgi:hypothetical protein
MNKNLFNFVLAVTCLALAGMACSALSSTPSLANPSSTSSGGNTSGGAGKVLFQDDFSDSTSGWGTGTDANKSVAYSNNTLEFKVFKANDFVYSTPSDTDYQDVHIEVTVAPNISDKNTAFGILCDQQVTSEAFYYGAVTPAGQYAIAKAAVAKDDVFLTNNNNWATSNSIPVNASSYTVGMDCGSDGTLTLYVNGKQIDSVTDTTYTKGHVGLFAWSDKNANATDVNFSNYVAISMK